MSSCQKGEYHRLNKEGHVASEMGAYYLVSPCGTVRVQCRSRVKLLRKLSKIYCLTCADTHEVDDYLFEPIQA